MGLTRCSLAVVLRHCYSLIKFLDMSFSGASVIAYQRPQHQPQQHGAVLLHNGTAFTKTSKKRAASQPLEPASKHEPRILLRRLLISSEPAADETHTNSHGAGHNQQEEPRVIVTRSCSKWKKWERNDEGENLRNLLFSCFKRSVPKLMIYFGRFCFVCSVLACCWLAAVVVL